MIKYIIYCRKSTDEKTKQVLSIESQITELKEFAKREELSVVDVITEAKTAKTPGRSKFEQIIKMVETGKANGILAWHPDRLARNSIDGGKIIYLLDTGKLNDLKFPTFWFDNTPQGKFMLNIAFGQSKYYVDNLSENVKRGNRQKLRNGIWPNKAPLGYFNDRITKNIVVDPVISVAVKGAFKLFAKGNVSFTKVAKFLALHGVTKAGGKPLHLNQIKRMFCKKFYIGIMEYGGEYYQGSHECFISNELFDQVQQLLARKEESKTRPQEHKFNFLGLMKCAECGSSITAEKHTKHYKGTNRSVEYTYYRCTKKLGKCSQRYISSKKLVKQLENIVFDVSLPQSWTSDWLSWIKRDEAKEKRKFKENSQLLESSIQSTQSKLDKLLDLYLDQTLDEVAYKQKQNLLFDEKSLLIDQKDKLKENGSGWLEPMKEFVKSAINANKVKSDENNEQQLRTIAQSVGSNFILKDRQLSTEYQQPFKLLRAQAIARQLNSPSVTPRGIEPRFLG